MLVIAHRGDCNSAPENSMEAFRKAVEAGADGIELDVRTTSDGVHIVMHDPSLKRTAGARIVVSRATLAAIGRARLANGEHVPAFEDVLASLGSRISIYAELKDRSSAREVGRIAAEHTGSKVTVSSSDPLALADVKHLPKALVWDRRGDPVELALKCSCVQIHPRLRRVTKDMVAKSHASGLSVIGWDLKGDWGVSKAINLNLDGIISDDLAEAMSAVSR